MQLEHLSFDNVDWTLNQTSHGHAEIIHQLIAQHTLVREKLLPEIDMHFWSIKNNSEAKDNKSIDGVYQIFENYKAQLEDHFYFEETLVFPAILKQHCSQNCSFDEATEIFLQKHEDFESLLTKMIEDLHAKLSPLNTLMSWRMLQLKLERLVQVMENHQILEDYLFKTK